jgi:hypothetical protein
MIEHRKIADLKVRLIVMSPPRKVDLQLYQPSQVTGLRFKGF